MKLTNDDLREIEWLSRQSRNGTFTGFYVPKKRGSNVRGRGSDRSVILAKHVKSGQWVQKHKVWGSDNDQRAKEIVRQVLINTKND